MNSKSYFVVLVICGIVLCGLIARNGSVLLIALPFVVYLIVGILGSPVGMTLQIRRETDRAEVVAGQPIEMRISIENQGNPLTNIQLTDPIPEGMSVLSGQAHQRLALASGETTRLEYVAAATRGAYSWTSLHASASDPFGLFELKRELPAFAEVWVRPEPIKVRTRAIRPRTTLHAPGPMPAHLPGTGTDFWGVREYRSGDPTRRLNWRLAGRYPRRFFTNEFEGEEIADFGLIVDARRLTDARETENALFEHSVSAAASLSQMLLSIGNRVALLVFGETTTLLYPGSGKRQLRLVMHDLAHASLGSHVSFRYLEYFPVRVFPSRSVILIFSMLHTGDLDTYASLRAHGYDVLLISPDPIDYLSRTLPASEAHGLAVRAARVERAVQLQGLLQMGVGVVDWQVEKPLDTLLDRTVRDLARRRNM